jgi:sigma-54 dependent transcriptional regulator, acetoin dehydrogenase operon transcriptional activator AcoR
MGVETAERETRLMRDNFLAGQDVNPRLRAQIASSWRRSKLAGVDADSDRVPYKTLADGANRMLTEAATPVLDWLSDQLTGGIAVVLANAEARVLDRRAPGKWLSHRLDEMNCAPGFSFAEEHIGTNGIGCSLESSSSVMIVGPEHYRDMFAGMTCLGTPLRHPVHQRLVGSLSVTCRYEDTSDLMMPLQLSAAREIQSRMYAAVSLGERMLLEEFLKVSRRSSYAVVTLNQDFIMTNTAASTMLNPADHAVLWDWAMDSVTTRDEHSGDVLLSDGVVVRARVRTVGETKSGPAGVVVELRHRPPTDAGPRTVPRMNAISVLPGRSDTWARTVRELDEADNSARDVLLIGEPGTGKFHAAERIGTPDRVVFDAALSGLEADWLHRLKASLSSPGTVVVRHLDGTPDALIAAVAALLAADRVARVVATADPASDCRLLDYFSARVTIPSLRQRPQDIADMVPVLLRAAGKFPVPRLQAPALQALMKHEWRGNIRELSAVLGSAALCSMGADITLADLPAEYRQPGIGRLLPGLKRTERETILEALADAKGNKLLAAERLGIARSSLYRKMRALGIDAKRWT